MKLNYDLHIHSCLSPCADDDMTANNIANMASLCGIDIAALTDHNSLKNCPAFFAACARAGVTPIAGTELNTREEVHVLCLFPSLDAGMAFDTYIEGLLPHFVNNPKIFGNQIIVDGNDAVVGTEQKLLYAACDIGIDELPALLRAYGGVAVPSHIDRPSNSVISNLGFVSPEYGFAYYELQQESSLAKLLPGNPALAGAKFIYDSDAHSLADLASRDARAITLHERSAPSLIAALLG
ncbi:MAG: PHP domain-containing protein [Oscillospiraceae bacterium]|nr:PHP domain-containing protein [Oscillospiraceae bacterium]